MTPPSGAVRQLEHGRQHHDGQDHDGVPREARELEQRMLAALERSGDHLRTARRMLATGHLPDYGDSKDVGLVASLSSIGESLLVMATLALQNSAAERRRG